MHILMFYFFVLYFIVLVPSDWYQTTPRWLCMLLKQGYLLLHFHFTWFLPIRSFLEQVRFKLLGRLKHRISKATRVSDIFEACKRFKGGRTDFLIELCFVLGLAGIVGGASVKRWTSVYNHGTSLLTITTCSP